MPSSAASTASPPRTSPGADRLHVQRLAGGLDLLALNGLAGRHDAALVTVRGWHVAVADPVAGIDHPAMLDSLGRKCGWRDDPPDTSYPPFTGGAVGYLCEDAAWDWLALPPDERPDWAGLGSCRFRIYDTAVCVSPDGSTTWLVAADLPDSVEAAGTRLGRLREQVGAVRAADARLPALPPPSTPRLGLDEAAHGEAVQQILDWIAAGDLYQLNLTFQAAVDWPAPSGLLARRLFAATPGAGHAAWLRLDEGAEVVSVSPETFLRCDGDRALIRPIKGTRPRREKAAADARQAAALRASAKDAAEHVMIVDLERNDLGRVCLPGSVRVPALADLERHPTVWHLASTVRGTLRPDIGLGGLLAATFPCGSVTGAPKRMAVARTRLLEPLRRGVYCGAIGVVSRGMVDLSVAIRTAVVRDGVASYGTGGGIVADSSPRAEYAEAMDKARAFFTAVAATRN